MEGVGSRQHHHPPPQQKDRAGGRGKIRRKNERKDDSRSEYHDMAGKDDTDEKMVGKCHVAIRSIRHPIQGAYLVAENEMNRSQHSMQLIWSIHYRLLFINRFRYST